MFLGAGVSKSALNTMPSWAELLREMGANAKLQKDKKLIDSLIRSGRLLDAAELANSLMMPADRNALLERRFRLQPPPISELYADVLALDPKVCITTNYDQFIEKNFEHFSGFGAHQVRTYKYEHLLSDLRSPARIILKIHGCITDPPSIVLDRKSYFDAKSKHPGVYEVVSALLTVNTVLFLGYSMGDPDIQIVLEEVNSKLKTDHPHYAFLQKFEHPSLRDAYKHTYNIEFIEYPKGRHEAFPDALHELRLAVEAVRASTGMRV